MTTTSISELVERQQCSCMEVHGEDPDCIFHGEETEWALANILPSDWQQRVMDLRAERDALEALSRSIPTAAPDDATVERVHWSDCAVHNEPALPAGPCDCGGYSLLKDRERLALKIAEALAKSDGLKFGLPYKPWERHGYVAADIIIAALTASIPPTTAPEDPWFASMPQELADSVDTADLVCRALPDATATTAQGEVVQADREAASALWLKFQGEPYSEHDQRVAKEFRAGERDDDEFVEALRDHRLKATKECARCRG